jgi:hypothetical protein
VELYLHSYPTPWIYLHAPCRQKIPRPLRGICQSPTAMRGRYGRKPASDSRVKCPSLLTDFNLTCISCSACAGSAIYNISVTPQQYEGKNDRKTVAASGVKCPSLLTDLNVTCTSRNAYAGNVTSHLSSPTEMRGEIRTKSSFGHKGKFPFIPDPLQPKFHGF